MSPHKASVHKEIAFEDDICAHLAGHGWLYAPGDAEHYDRARALFPPDLIAWVQETQPMAWEALTKTHGASVESGAETVLLDRVRKQLDARGTLDVLRHGVEILGLKKPLQLAQFKPALAMNPDLQARYAANRLRVVRQVHYSLHNENSLDLVLFLNGIGISTGELKTDFTQSVEDAVDQYHFDRDPRPKGQGKPEPLLSFPNGALVHFAISNSQVRMTTRLQGPATTFLPFDQGDGGGAGNPVNPAGHRTAYL
jgi:type I restriction enzyme, R subunit